MVNSISIKYLLTILLLFSSYISSEEYTHTIILNNEETTVDGLLITSDSSSDVYIQDGEKIIHYEKEYASEEGYGDSTTESEWHSIDECNEEKLITITKAGNYLISGTLKGQLSIDGQNTDKFTLYLNGVNITSEVAPGLIFYKANEIDSTEYEDDGIVIEYSVAANLNFSEAGAKVIIKDDSINYVQGSHVAKCYKYSYDENDTRVYATKKRAKYDGAFYSKVSLSIDGETKKNGILNIVADNEGLDTEKHLLINGGIINIASQDDGINTNEEGGSVTLIKGGTVTINGGLGAEGDGIDSNGYLIITGGNLITAASPMSDSGMDADNGVIVNGGNIIAVGSTMDGASSESTQCTMNLQFSKSVESSSKLVIKDEQSNTVASFKASDVNLFSTTKARYFTGTIISNSNFSLNKNYYLYIDDVQYCYSENGGNNGGMNPGDQNFNGSGGVPPDNNGTGGFDPDNNGTGGVPPDNNGTEGFDPDNNGNGGVPPDNNGTEGFDPDNNGTERFDPNNNGNGGIPPNNNGNGGFNPNNNGNGGFNPNNNGNGGIPPDNNGTGGFDPNKNGNGNFTQMTNKKFTLNSTVSTFRNIQICSDSELESSTGLITNLSIMLLLIILLY